MERGQNSEVIRDVAEFLSMINQRDSHLCIHHDVGKEVNWWGADAYLFGDLTAATLAAKAFFLVVLADVDAMLPNESLCLSRKISVVASRAEKT